MPDCQFKNKNTNEIRTGINFGGTDQIVYEVNGTLVYAPEGGTDITKTGVTSTLNPLGLTSDSVANNWEIISHQNINTCNWRVTVQNIATQEQKTGVYPFNLDGKLYQLPCGGNEWVLASCGGTEIQDNGGVNAVCYTLKGTGEVIKLNKFIYKPLITFKSFSGECFSSSEEDSINHNTGSAINIELYNFPDYPLIIGGCGSGLYKNYFMVNKQASDNSGDRATITMYQEFGSTEFGWSIVLAYNGESLTTFNLEGKAENTDVLKIKLLDITTGRIEVFYKINDLSGVSITGEATVVPDWTT